MKKIILIIFISVFSLSIVFMGTGCNTAELEELTKKIEDKENEAQELQDKTNKLEAELTSLKAAKNLIAFIVGEDGAPLSVATVTLDLTPIFGPVFKLVSKPFVN